MGRVHRVGGRSEATGRAYRQDLARWERVGQDPAAYLAGPPSSRARRYGSLWAYWRWAEGQGLTLGPFPLAGIPHPRVDMPPPRALPEADEARLVAAIRGPPLAWRTLFTLMLDTGLRAGEATGLRVRDLEGTPGSEGLRVQGKGRKWREVPLLPGKACRPHPRRAGRTQGQPAQAGLGRHERRLSRFAKQIGQQLTPPMRAWCYCAIRRTPADQTDPQPGCRPGNRWRSAHTGRRARPSPSDRGIQC